MSGSLNSRITGTSIKYQPLQLESDIDVRRKLFRQKQYKKMCFAAAMAVLGFIMIVVGISWYFVDRKGYSAFMLVGFLAFLPGSYGTYEVSHDCCSIINTRSEIPGALISGHRHVKRMEWF